MKNESRRPPAVFLGLLLTLPLAAQAFPQVGSSTQDVSGATGLERGYEARLRRAQTRLLEAAPEEKAAAFQRLAAAVSHSADDAGLPSFGRDFLYGPEWREFRARWYGPMLQDEATREWVYDHVRNPGQLELWYELTLCAFFADAPSVEHARVMLEGYRNCEPTARSRYSRGRELGRTYQYLVATGTDEAEIAAEEILEELRSHLQDEDLNLVSHSLEGLARAGLLAEVQGRVEEIALHPDTAPGEVISVLGAVQTLMREDRVDPFFRAWSVDFAVNYAEESLQKSREGNAVARSVGADAAAFKTAVDYLHKTTPESCIDYLLTCMTEPERAALLGMDDLQDLRTDLQEYRHVAPEAVARRMDDTFLRVLADAGERLFSLEEEPMSRDEIREFLGTKDIRYNAASYFDDLWDDIEGVHQVFAVRPDLPDLLLAIVHADHEEPLGNSEDALFAGLIEKAENRVLAATLLARAQRDLGTDPRMDLDKYFLRTLAAQVHDDPTQWDGIDLALMPRVAIAVVQEPEDRWMQHACTDALEILGWTVTEEDELLLIDKLTPASSSTSEDEAWEGGR